MENNLENRVLELQHSVKKLIDACNSLSYENQVLKKREHELMHERSDLQAKNDQVRVQVEAMVSRLKSLDVA